MFFPRYTFVGLLGKPEVVTKTLARLKTDFEVKENLDRQAIVNNKCKNFVISLRWPLEQWTMEIMVDMP